MITATWKKAEDGAVCLNVPKNGTAGVDRCEDKRSGNERTSLRTYWDPSRNAIVSPFKNPDICMDADGDQLVSKLCSETSKWQRTGPPGPNPPLPPPGPEPAPLVGNSSLFWPVVGGVTGINEKGYPDYWGNNQAEACPAHRRVNGGSQCQWPAKSDVPMYRIKNHVHGSGHEMTRSMILQRALVWVSHNFAGQDWIDKKNNAVGVEGCSEGESRDVCPQFFHGGACCSMPAMAWNISYCVKGPGSMGEKINCDDLRPGDALSFGGHHVALFAKWSNDKKKDHFHIYERKGPARVTQRGRSKNLICLRRKMLIEDVEPDDIPVALPREAGDDEEVQEIDDPEPLDYNGECDDLDPVDYNCDASNPPTAEAPSAFIV